MPYEAIAGSGNIASLLLADTGDGHVWGENLMKLTGAIRVTGGIYDPVYASYSKKT